MSLTIAPSSLSEVDRPRVYRPRRPRQSPLFKILADHLQGFLDDYETVYQKVWGPLRRVVLRSVEGFLACGLLERGFARIRCPACRSEYLLAFSCRVRGLCASCGAKRSAAWARWVVTELAREVPHRQIVVTLPKILRPYFKYDRSLLTELSRWVYECIRELMSAVADEPVRPGCLSVLELAGNLLNLQPHLHQIVTDGAFDLSGERFTSLPPRLWRLLEERVRHKVLGELHALGLLSSERREMLLTWRHSGFSVHVGRPLSSLDRAGLERVARYVHRLHLADSRIHYDEERDRVIYSSGKRPHPGFKANFRLFTARDFVAAVCAFVPDRYRHQTVAYGEYSNAVRGRRRKAGLDPGLEVQPVSRRRARAAWRELIRLIYEVDPLRCACGETMRVASIITDPSLIQRILDHLGLWPPPRRAPKKVRPQPPPRPAPQVPPPPGLLPSESEASQIPPGWDDPESFNQAPPGWDE